MVKSILVDENVAKYIETFVKGKTATVGLIIGKTTKLKDYVVKIVRCLENDDSKPSEFKIDDMWIAGSALEISHMLPGGLSVIGIVAIAPPDADMQSSLRRALYCTHKLLSKSRCKRSFDNDSDTCFTAFHIDVTTGRSVSCKQYDMMDNASAAKPADWRYLNISTRWSSIKAHIEIDTCLHVNEISTNTEQQLKDSISAYCDKILNTLVVIDDKICEMTETYDPGSVASVAKGKKNKNALTKKWGRTSWCQLYVNEDEDDIAPAKEIAVTLSTHLIHVKGTIYACAYLPSKATVKEVIDELKQDAVQSLHHRCALAAEDLQDRKENIKENSNIVLPRRLAFTCTNDTEDFMFFDYTFNGENLEDSVNRIKETLDTTVDPSSLRTNLETFPENPYDEGSGSEDYDDMAKNMNDSANFQDIAKKSSSPGLTATIGAAFAAGIALLVAGFSYLSLSD